MLEDSFGLLILFPLWNLLYVFAPIWIFEVLDEPGEFVLDYDTTLPQLLIGSMVVGFVLYYCTIIAGYHWSLSFSIAVFYSEAVDGLLRKLVDRSVALLER